MRSNQLEPNTIPKGVPPELADNIAVIGWAYAKLSWLNNCPNGRLKSDSIQALNSLLQQSPLEDVEKLLAEIDDLKGQLRSLERQVNVPPALEESSSNSRVTLKGVVVGFIACFLLQQLLSRMF